MTAPDMPKIPDGSQRSSCHSLFIPRLITQKRPPEIGQVDHGIPQQIRMVGSAELLKTPSICEDMP